MQSTYEYLKSLPGKGTNWAAIQAALIDMQPTEYFSDDQKARWLEPGIRAARTAAMELAVIIVHRASRRSVFIPPSEETLSWGGFLGGESLVITDDTAADAATARVIAAAEAARYSDAEPDIAAMIAEHQK